MAWPKRILRTALCAAVVVGTAWVLPQAMSSAAGTAAPADTAWTGTWAAAAQSSDTTFNKQTLRQIVHTSISGSVARIHLSNVFGSQPVVIGDVHIAQRTSGSSVDTGTDRAVTFGGQAGTTIPTGGSVVSDTISFPVAAQSDVAISVFLPQATGPATSHQLGNQDNYVASGDVSANATLSNPQTTGSYYFLTNLDVQNPDAAGAVVTLGASITDGIASAANDNHRWPNDLATRLLGAGHTVGVLNEGISGNQLLNDGAGQSALNRFDRDVLQQPGVRWVIFSDDPINDLGNNPPPSTDQLLTALKQLISQAHQGGIKFFCSTLTPFQGSGGWTQQGETEREAIDSFIRGADSGCDGIVDQDTATHDPANPTRYLPAFNSGDSLHPNEAGLQAIANAVNLDLFGAGGSTPTAPVISLKAHANGDYVTAESAGASALIANRTAIGPWEQFDEVSEANGTIALRSHANNKYVTAGTAPLIADSTTAGQAQTFQLIHNSDGSISLLALANGDYVTAESAGASALIANRTAIGPWEEFDLTTS
jgi:lysophospholipase L1-like esterase